MKKNIVLLLCIIFIISCKKDQENNQQLTYHLESYNDDRLESTELYDSVHVYHLESKEQFLISTISKMCKSEDSFYFLDKSKSIFKYDKLGKAMDVCSRKGRGHLEYLDVLDFDINEANDTIALLCLPPKIIYLDKDLNAISEFKLNTFYERLCYYKDKILLYGYQMEVLDLLEPNKTMKKLTTFSNIANFVFNKTPVFHKSNDQLLIIPCASKHIYSLDEEDSLYIYANIDSDGFENAINYYKHTPYRKQTTEDRMEHLIPRILNVSYSKNGWSFIYSKLGIYNKMSHPKKFKGTIQYDFSDDRIYAKNSFFGVANSFDMTEIPYNKINTKIINPHYESDNPKIIRAFYKNNVEEIFTK